MSLSALVHPHNIKHATRTDVPVVGKQCMSGKAKLLPKSMCLSGACATESALLNGFSLLLCYYEVKVMLLLYVAPFDSFYAL